MLGNGELPYKINAEINDSNFHQRGALGMARDNNPEKSSSACQFYIVTGRKFTDPELDRYSQMSGRKFTPHQREVYKTIGGTANLDGNYTIFGIVTEGMDVVEKISMMPRDGLDRPNTDIRMNKVYLQEEPKHTPQAPKEKKTKK
jgi:peptidyl-prolyl cis-trans isomerase B (cyclophilin B)